ncbi:hypothetical protein [Natrinema sp. DC36]|uniref:hypothetical protein n=1 Tax=Natrinema sp. DC36 TaxID=2878680 RepID=UPI001CF07F0C|nr:hypothetical protein [Natrinema sp. DC36]
MKNNDMHDLRVSARTARLTAAIDDDDEDEDGPPWRFSGIAVAAGDILHMDDGTRVLMTAEELRKAAESQADEPLTTDHPADDEGRPQYPPPTDETIGKVPKAGWIDDQQAVGYEASTHDENVAKGVRGESYDVSVHPRFRLGEFREDVQAYVGEDIEFLDLSVVSKGDSPSNTAKWGPSQALASYTEETDIGSQLTAGDGSGTGPDFEDSPNGAIGAAVRGTLQAIGFDIGRSDDLAGENGNPLPEPSDLTANSTDTETTGAESPTDDPDPTDMDDNTREQYITFLTANADFDKESLEAMDDNVLNQTYELAAENAASDGGDGGSNDDPDNGGDDKTLGDMTVDELGSALRDQGFVTEDNASDLVAQAQEEATKAQKVEEIIANSDQYEEDDREDLMASADTLVDSEYDRATGKSGMGLPGAAGLTASAAAGGSNDNGADEDPDEYGTGVAEN